MLPVILGALPLLAKIPAAIGGIASILGFDDVADVAGKVDGLVSEIENGTKPPLTPEQTAALQQLTNTHAQEMARIALQEKGLDIDVEKAYLQDRGSARQRDTELHKAGYTNHRATIMLAVAFFAFCFISYLIYKDSDMSEGVLAIMNMSIGALLKMLSDGFAFEFGSSRGSKEKTDFINRSG